MDMIKAVLSQLDKAPSDLPDGVECTMRNAAVLIRGLKSRVKELESEKLPEVSAAREEPLEVIKVGDIVRKDGLPHPRLAYPVCVGEYLYVKRKKE